MSESLEADSRKTCSSVKETDAESQTGIKDEVLNEKQTQANNSGSSNQISAVLSGKRSLSAPDYGTTKRLQDSNEKEIREEANAKKEQKSWNPKSASPLERFAPKRSLSAPAEVTPKKPRDEFQVTDSIFLDTSKKMSPHGNVFEGEIRGGLYGVRECAVKYFPKTGENTEEARILTKLGSHTHVISIIQSGVYKDVFEEHVYIALEKCHKQNLSQYFENRKETGLVYDVNIGLEYSKQIIAGMTYVHETLIFHKDLKPSNILLSLDTRTIKLADFGSSQELKSISSKVFCKHQFGTNGFRSVEGFGNSWASLKSDIFSLGVVLYFILSDGKSPFGENPQLWSHNTVKGVCDTSQLSPLIPNPKATEHLIRSMLSQERCCRPSIWQVANHPCWTEKEVECDLDFGFEEENDDSDIRSPQSQESGDPKTEIERTRELLRELKNIGYCRSPVRRISIIVFGINKPPRLFNPRDNSSTQMPELIDELKRQTWIFSVSLGDHIYVLWKTLMCRLKYCDVNAVWERMPDLIRSHGWHPTPVATPEAIIIAGSSGWKFAKSVTKFDPSQNQWVELQDKQLATSSSANVVSQGYVYCFGGGLESTGITNRAERMNLLSKTWEEIAPMRETRYKASAVACGGNIFVAGGRHREDDNSVETYDPAVNEWTIVKPMIEGRSITGFRCHFIDGFIYAVGPNKKGIEKYDIKRNEWEVVKFPDFEICDSVAVEQKECLQKEGTGVEQKEGLLL